jgi:hypothetical protein
VDLTGNNSIENEIKERIKHIMPTRPHLKINYSPRILSLKCAGHW